MTLLKFFGFCTAVCAISASMTTGASAQYASRSGAPNPDVVVNWDLIDQLGAEPTVPGQIYQQGFYERYRPHYELKNMPNRPIWRNTQPFQRQQQMAPQPQYSDSTCCRMPPPPPAADPKSYVNEDIARLLELRENSQSPTTFGQGLPGLPTPPAPPQPVVPDVVEPRLAPTPAPTPAPARAPVVTPEPEVEDIVIIDEVEEETSPTPPAEEVETSPVKPQQDTVVEDIQEDIQEEASDVLESVEEIGEAEEPEASPDASEEPVAEEAPAAETPKKKGFFQSLFGFGDDDDETPEPQGAAPAQSVEQEQLPDLESLFEEDGPSDATDTPDPEAAPAPEAEAEDEPVDMMAIIQNDVEFDTEDERKEAVVAAITPPSYKNMPPRQRILFENYGLGLSNAAESELEKAADILNNDPNVRIQLYAYAAAGEDEASQSNARRVSLSRALAARAYLLEQDVTTTRIDVRALGADERDGPADRVDLIYVPR